MITKKDFFTHLNSVEGISEDDYQMASKLVGVVGGLACTTYQGIYIIDYYKQNFLYVSDNPLFLCGKNPADICRKGHDFYLQNVPENEHNLLLAVNRAGFEFFDSIPVEQRMEYMISYEFHLDFKRKPVLVNHKLKPIALDKNGHVWLACCMVSFSARKEAGHIHMHHINTNEEWEYSLAEMKWKKQEPMKLSDKEKEVLVLSAQGYTMEQIADKMQVSVNTVKFHKRNLFDKMHVESVVEALAYAQNSKLI